MMTINRRGFLRTALSGAAAIAAGAACAPAAPQNTPVPQASATPQAPATAAPPTATSAPLGLGALAKAKGIRFGSAVSFRQFESPVRDKMLSVYARDMAFATLHSGFYWSPWEPERGKISTTALDQLKQQAEALTKIGITDLRGHPVVYFAYGPDWLNNGLKSGAIGRSEASDILVRHVGEVMGAFKGVIREWVVVNEPYRENGPDQPDLFQRVIGDDYVDMAFKAAREADPGAKLLLNDYENHSLDRYKSRVEVNKTILDRLKAAGLVDGMGLQMHLDMNKMTSNQDMIDTFKYYGMPIHVTELDINIAAFNRKDGDAKRFDLQGKAYKSIVNVAIRSGVCKSICLWEFGDKDSWLEDPFFSFSSPNSDCTPWDDALEPKPAYFQMRTAFGG
jgi:endo-1,4-beta-xylanase